MNFKMKAPTPRGWEGFLLKKLKNMEYQILKRVLKV